jgi:hypothetical protein
MYTVLTITNEPRDDQLSHPISPPFLSFART